MYVQVNSWEIISKLWTREPIGTYRNQVGSARKAKRTKSDTKMTMTALTFYCTMMGLSGKTNLRWKRHNESWDYAWNEGKESWDESWRPAVEDQPNAGAASGTQGVQSLVLSPLISDVFASFAPRFDTWNRQFKRIWNSLQPFFMWWNLSCRFTVLGIKQTVLQLWELHDCQWRFWCQPGVLPRCETWDWTISSTVCHQHVFFSSLNFSRNLNSFLFLTVSLYSVVVDQPTNFGDELDDSSDDETEIDMCQLWNLDFCMNKPLKLTPIYFVPWPRLHQEPVFCQDLCRKLRIVSRSLNTVCKASRLKVTLQFLKILCRQTVIELNWKGNLNLFECRRQSFSCIWPA